MQEVVKKMKGSGFLLLGFTLILTFCSVSVHADDNRPRIILPTVDIDDGTIGGSSCITEKHPYFTVYVWCRNCDHDDSYWESAPTLSVDGRKVTLSFMSGNHGWKDAKDVYQYTCWDGDKVYYTVRTRPGFEVNSLFFSSGRICQSRFIKHGDHYRIYSAVDAPMGVGCLVLYSDDFGHSWQALGGPSTRPTTAPWGDEAKVEELPDGNVLLSCRSKLTATSGRLYNIYDYATGSWSEMAVSNDPELGTCSESCSCNGELLIVPVMRTSDNRSMHLAL